MKPKHAFTFSLLALGIAAASAQDNKITVPGLGAQPAPAMPAAAAATPSFTDAQLLEEFGWFIGKRVGLTELEFSTSDVAAMVKGLTAAAAGKDSPFELEKIGPLMDEFMQKKQTAYMTKVKAAATVKNDEFFAKLKENKAVQETPSGLRYEISSQGTGPGPKPEDTVKVHYTGTLIDGKVFDSSVQRGQPLDIPLNQVVPGWTEGLQKIGKGGKMKLYIPPQLGYGDEGNGGIPPGSTLIFDVELLDFKPAAAAAPAPAMPMPMPAPGK